MSIRDRLTRFEFLLIGCLAEVFQHVGESLREAQDSLYEATRVSDIQQPKPFLSPPLSDMSALTLKAQLDAVFSGAETPLIRRAFPDAATRPRMPSIQGITYRTAVVNTADGMARLVVSVLVSTEAVPGGAA